jgi:hypothetical protein
MVASIAENLVNGSIVDRKPGDTLALVIEARELDDSVADDECEFIPEPNILIGRRGRPAGPLLTHPKRFDVQATGIMVPLQNKPCTASHCGFFPL